MSELTNREKWIVVGWVITTLLMYFGNANSEKANNIAQRELVLSQRPYITIEPVKFPDTDKYISLRKGEKGLEIRILFKISNTGNSVAKNVKTSDIFLTSSQIRAQVTEISSQRQIKCSQGSGQNDLAPGESTLFSIITFQQAQDDVLENTLKNFEGGFFELPVNLEVYYDSDLLEHRAKTALSIIMRKNEIIRNYNLKEDR